MFAFIRLTKYIVVVAGGICVSHLIYCEILFIRGDPIFVVFVVGLAHEFTIPRIMNTT